MWKEEGGRGGRGNHSQLQEGGREGGGAGRGKQAGRQWAEPQVGEERVFPVSHEVIHRETSDFADLLLCP